MDNRCRALRLKIIWTSNHTVPREAFLIQKKDNWLRDIDYDHTSFVEMEFDINVIHLWDFTKLFYAALISCIFWDPILLFLLFLLFLLCFLCLLLLDIFDETYKSNSEHRSGVVFISLFCVPIDNNIVCPTCDITAEIDCWVAEKYL